MASRLMRPLVCLLIETLIAGAGPGCVVQHRVQVSGHALYATLGERQARGEAQVPASDVTEDGETATTERIGRDAVLGLDGGKIRLSELDRGCVAKDVKVTSARVETAETATATATMPATEAEPLPATDLAATPEMGLPSLRPGAAAAGSSGNGGCPLQQYADTQLEVRMYNETKAPPLGTAVGVLALSAIGAAVVCEVACADDTTPKTASDITLISLGALFATALVWSFIDCMGKWGQPGCRD
jgi:hypothetical protein